MENKTCSKCSQTKPLNEFRRDNSIKGGYKQPCQKCNGKIVAAWKKQKYKDSPDYRQKVLARSTIDYRNYTRRRRAKVLESYGGKCVCCGETEQQFLSIDHIYNDGAEHRRQLNMKSGSEFYMWLKKNNFPKDRFQLLCHNCNFAKGLYGECPHKKQQ